MGVAMKFLTIEPLEGIAAVDGLSPTTLLQFVADTATDHALIADDLALVVGENSLHRPGQPFLEVASLIPGAQPELVRGPAAVVRVTDGLDLQDLEDRPGGIEVVRAHLAAATTWWWPVRIEGEIYLRDASGSRVRRHPVLAYATFSEDDFGEQVTKNP
jgi:hypothetical protein